MYKTCLFILFCTGVLFLIALADDIYNPQGDVVAQTLESHYDYGHFFDPNELRFEDRDPNCSILTFTFNEKTVILDNNKNGELCLKFENCSKTEGAEVVWEAVSSIMSQLNYTAKYMQRLADAID